LGPFDDNKNKRFGTFGLSFLFLTFLGCLILHGRQRGFQNLYTLKGGVSHYLQNEGPVEWVGNLFVFDDRLSLPPSAYNPEDTTVPSSNPQGCKNILFANCYICGSQVSELRHRNCANIDCNLLFL
jgi:predicted sulfurtransferase